MRAPGIRRHKRSRIEPASNSSLYPGNPTASKKPGVRRSNCDGMGEVGDRLITRITVLFSRSELSTDAVAKGLEKHNPGPKTAANPSYLMMQPGRMRFVVSVRRCHLSSIFQHNIVSIRIGVSTVRSRFIKIAWLMLSIMTNLSAQGSFTTPSLHRSIRDRKPNPAQVQPRPLSNTGQHS